MKLQGLSRKIMLWMAAIAGGASLLVTGSMYAFFAIWASYWPTSFNESSFVPGTWEWLWILTATTVCLALASVAGAKFSARLLVPLNSVTTAIREVAQGNLTARATAGEHSLGEATNLANDFNELAENLQRVTEEQKFWNAAIAHELRTPITVLRGRLQGLADGVFEPSEVQFQKLLGQVEHLGRLVEDLRTIGLADAGHLDLRCEDAELSEIVLSAVNLFSERFAKSEHSPALELQLGTAWCDPMRIKQALIALFENVHKHAGKGLVYVRIRMNENKHYVLEVEDEGPGVPRSTASTIFRAFHQGPHSARTQGSGLGLAVVAAIARAHGGNVTYQQAPSGGSLFTLTWMSEHSSPLPVSTIYPLHRREQFHEFD